MLDSSQRVLWVGGDWDDFAADNRGTAARASKVLGTRLPDHMAGQATQQVLSGVLTDVLELKRAFRVDCRCDSPSVRRHMRMTVTPMRADRLMVTHDLRDAQNLPKLGQGWHWQPGARDCKCSFCCALRRGKAWVDPFATGEPHPEAVDFDICPDCRATIDRERTRIRKAGRAG